MLQFSLNTKILPFLYLTLIELEKGMNKNFRVVELPQNLDIKYYPFKVPYTE